MILPVNLKKYIDDKGDFFFLQLRQNQIAA